MNKHAHHPKDMYYEIIKMMPKGTRDDVAKLHQFVLVAQNCAVSAFIDDTDFKNLLAEWKKAKKNLGLSSLREESSKQDDAVRHISYVIHHYKCDPLLVDRFLKAIYANAKSGVYATLAQQQNYIDAVAGSIAVIVTKIIGLNGSDAEFITAQSRAFMQIVLLRNAGEDSLNEKFYFPTDDLMLFGIKKFDEETAARKPAEFREFMQYQVARYLDYQSNADSIHPHLPLKMRVALKAAIDMNGWIANEILDNPTQIFDKKIEPSRLRRAYIQTLRRVGA
jgi:15-cis-phytoene synthase